MSRLTAQQEGLLGLQLQHSPEFRTGLYESEPYIGFGDVFSAPVGPLYNVNYVPGSESYFEQGDDFQEHYGQAAGPLRNIDMERTSGIISALEANDPTGKLAENFMSTLRPTDAGDIYQVVQSRPTKYAELQPTGDFDITPRMDISTVPAQEQEGEINYGYTYGPTKDTEGLPQTGRVYINPDLAEFITTKPTSPRNEQLVDATHLGMGYAKPVDLMNKAVDTIQHEYAHNILDLPGFENIKKSAINAGVPSNLKLEGPPKLDYMQEHTNEEIFNRALDIERYYRKHGDINNPAVRMDLDHIQQLLDKKYKKPTDGRWSSALSYVNSMRPQVLSYFDEIERQSKMGWINKQKTKRGMPEHLGDAGQSLDDMSGVKKKAVPIHSPHGGGGGGPKAMSKYRASRPASERRYTGHGKSGMGRDKSKLMAHGGLIDIPLPGRSRDI